MAQLRGAPEFSQAGMSRELSVQVYLTSTSDFGSPVGPPRPLATSSRSYIMLPPSLHDRRGLTVLALVLLILALVVGAFFLLPYLQSP